MKRNFSFLLTIFIALAAFVSVSLAEHFSQNNRSLSLRELLTNANTYHGQVVTLQGELIGDLIRAPEGFWVNLLEGPNCLGLWFPREMMPRIGQLGRYQVRGDIVEVQGTFFQHCPLHGTGPDLHVISMKVVLP
ncbi:MAG TPA: hypothetical protein PKW42_07190, partial [bacterium]|nr:hypothetical protein [bacterium]